MSEKWVEFFPWKFQTSMETKKNYLNTWLVQKSFICNLLTHRAGSNKETPNFCSFWLCEDWLVDVTPGSSHSQDKDPLLMISFHCYWLLLEWWKQKWNAPFLRLWQVRRLQSRPINPLCLGLHRSDNVTL